MSFWNSPNLLLNLIMWNLFHKFGNNIDGFFHNSHRGCLYVPSVYMACFARSTANFLFPDFFLNKIFGMKILKKIQFWKNQKILKKIFLKNFFVRKIFFSKLSDQNISFNPKTIPDLRACSHQPKIFEIGPAV